MVIHVIARQVGEAARRDAYAIQTVLIESMGGGLKRQMRDAFTRDLVKLAVQRDWIRRGQRAIDGAFWRYQTDGADACGRMPEVLPDLSRERGNRSLAAGTGDGGDRRRLKGVEFRGGQSQRAARIGRCDERNGQGILRR